MTMPFRLSDDDFEFMQTDHDHVDGRELLAEVSDDEEAVTRAIRAWISPRTARKVALIARTHDVSSTLVIGAMLARGVRDWPGQFESRDGDDEGPDPVEIMTQYDRERS